MKHTTLTSHLLSLVFLVASGAANGDGRQICDSFEFEGNDLPTQSLVTIALELTPYEQADNYASAAPKYIFVMVSSSAPIEISRQDLIDGYFERPYNTANGLMISSNDRLDFRNCFYAPTLANRKRYDGYKNTYSDTLINGNDEKTVHGSNGIARALKYKFMKRANDKDGVRFPAYLRVSVVGANEEGITLNSVNNNNYNVVSVNGKTPEEILLIPEGAAFKVEGDGVVARYGEDKMYKAEERTAIDGRSIRRFSSSYTH